MKRFFGRRGFSAVASLLILGAGSSGASAQALQAIDVKAAVAAGESASAPKQVLAASAHQAKAAQITTSAAVATVTGTVIQARPAASVRVSLAPDVKREATWLHTNGWPLYALVDRYSIGAPLDEQANCIAVAVYFEARGETLDGQLAVARVIMNRAASGRYPPSWCEVVKQPWQFSFVRYGQFPAVDYGSDAWRKAQGITRLAVNDAVPSVSTDVLWYHADYVAPSWGRRLTRVNKIGAHIFYRA